MTCEGEDQYVYTASEVFVVRSQVDALLEAVVGNAMPLDQLSQLNNTEAIRKVKENQLLYLLCVKHYVLIFHIYTYQNLLST